MFINIHRWLTLPAVAWGSLSQCCQWLDRADQINWNAVRKQLTVFGFGCITV